MNIAILGGSFDPPHRGHKATAKRLLRLFNFDQIWLMPLFQHPFNKSLSPSTSRFEMTKYLENNKIKISDLELKRKSVSYTIDTLNLLRDQRPQDKFVWIIGTDQVASFAKWKNWKEIIDKFKLIVVPRTNFKKAKEELNNISQLVSFPKNIILVDRKKFKPIYISSTLTRKRINENKPIKNLVPKKVEEYIIENKLYL